VSFLAAVVLYIVSVGNVRGFAFTLGLTTVVDVIVAFLFTHPVVVFLARSSWMQHGGVLTGLSPRRLGGRHLDQPLAKGAKATVPQTAPAATSDDEGGES